MTAPAKETVIEMITREPHNYAYMTGALLALLCMLEGELEISRKYSKAISRKEVARIVAWYNAIEAAQKAALAEERRIENDQS